jgi:hypothetical protein
MHSNVTFHDLGPVPFGRSFGLDGVGGKGKGGGASDKVGVNGELTLAEFLARSEGNARSRTHNGGGGSSGSIREDTAPQEDAGAGSEGDVGDRDEDVAANYVFEVGSDAVAELILAANIPDMPAQLQPPDLPKQKALFWPKPPQFYLGPAGSGASATTFVLISRACDGGFCALVYNEIESSSLLFMRAALFSFLKPQVVGNQHHGNCTQCSLLRIPSRG